MPPRKGQLTSDDFPYVKGHCRFCKKRLSGRKRAWCSKKCVRAYLMTTCWATILAAVMRRDRRACRMCGARATEVDHIVELADGGSFHELSNLRAMCHDCHLTKTIEAARRRRERKRSD